jgi:5-methylcytosine-specific restriction endonuclease McrA
MTRKRPLIHEKMQKMSKAKDDYVCSFCNKKEKSAHAHHLIPFSEGGTASLKNFITLCSNCHKDYHSRKIIIDIDRF